MLAQRRAAPADRVVRPGLVLVRRGEHAQGKHRERRRRVRARGPTRGCGFWATRPRYLVSITIRINYYPLIRITVQVFKPPKKNFYTRLFSLESDSENPILTS